MAIDLLKEKIFASDVNTIKQSDMWRLTADKTSDGDITSNLERVDDASFGLIGTGMTESSGVFSFPETGIYKVDFIASGVRTVTGTDNIEFHIFSTIDNSNYTLLSYGVLGAYGGQLYDQGIISTIIDVTNTSNVKVKFRTASHADTNTVINGSSSSSETAFSFIRLGDT
jgi:hypothetical protein